MTRAIAIDGRVVDEASAHVSLFDRGLLHGDAVFEILRTYHGRAFALSEHVERLARSAEIARIPLPIDRAEFAREIADAVSRAGSGDFSVRVVLTRGTGAGLDLDAAQTPRRFIIVEPLRVPPARGYDEGIRAITRTRAPSEIAAAKSTNYLPNILALHDAKARGASEVVFVDSDGIVREAATSNVFAVVGGTLVTPRADGAILAGLTRSHVLSLARALGVATEERDLRHDELALATEIFVTSTIRELLSLSHLDDRAVGSGRPGLIARALHTAFRARARGEDVRSDIVELAAAWTTPA